MMQVIGAYTATIFLLDFMENVILLHNPLPYVWESLHLGLATITVLLVVAYLTYITIRVYSVSRLIIYINISYTYLRYYNDCHHPYWFIYLSSPVMGLQEL